MVEVLKQWTHNFKNNVNQHQAYSLVIKQSLSSNIIIKCTILIILNKKISIVFCYIWKSNVLMSHVQSQ